MHFAHGAPLHGPPVRVQDSGMRLADCTAALVHRDAKHGETSAQLLEARRLVRVGVRVRVRGRGGGRVRAPAGSNETQTS